MPTNYESKRITNKVYETVIRDLIKSGIKNRQDLDCFKRKMAKKYQTPCPKNVDLLKTYHKLLQKKRAKPGQAKQGQPQLSEVSPQIIEGLLRTRPVRSLSGIVNVSVLTKPYPCPGKCIFCPAQKGIPKSYLQGEPAVQRAILNKFSPYLQVQTRLQSLEQIGHPIDKIEMRVIGGTWSYYPKKYQTWFVKECFRTCNEFSAQPSSKTQILNKKAMAFILSIEGLKKEMVKEQKKNEKAKCRIVGLSIETRPDYITLEEIKRLRELGVTKVELGVQSLYDDVLKLNKRGHGVAATIKATKLLKDVGFKVSYQMMLNLPGSNFKRDVAMFKELFQNPDFKPDLLKIYPLALVKQAPIYKLYKEKKFKPYSDKKLRELLIEIKKYIPRWCRIERIVRDIPATDIVEGGAKVLNLREIVAKEMKKRGLQCQCIRCREVGRNYNPKEKLYLFREDYEASGSKEIFLTFESIEADKRRLTTPINAERKLYALLRLRINENHSRYTLPVLKNAAVIREVHTYGQAALIGPAPAALGGRSGSSPQHKGLGKKLIQEAEKIAKAAGLPKVAVISAVGTRAYYRKLGYRLKDTYMVKRI